MNCFSHFLSLFGESICRQRIVSCLSDVDSSSSSPVSLSLSAEDRPRPQPSVPILPGRRQRGLGSHQEQAGPVSSHQRAAALHVAAHPAEVPAPGFYSLSSPHLLVSDLLSLSYLFKAKLLPQQWETGAQLWLHLLKNKVPTTNLS